MADEERGEGAKERILATAIELIEREGTAKATTRAIATAAGVNVAAINYYFRSKDALVEAALAVSWNHAMEDILAFIGEDPWDPRSALLSIASFLYEGAIHYPRITRANLFDSNGRPLEPVARGLGILVDRLTERLAGFFGIRVEEGKRDAVLAFLSSIVFPILVPFSPNRLESSEARARYLGSIVETLLDGFNAGDRSRKG